MLRKLSKVQSTSIHPTKPCPICSSQSLEPLYCYNFNKKLSHIVKCTQCGHMWIDPLPLVTLDQRNMDFVDDEFFGNIFLHFLCEHFVVRPEIPKVKKWVISENPRMLDIGCGPGWIASIWQKAGFSVLGLEPSQKRCQRCKDRFGIEVFNGYIEDFNLAQKFDVITIRHVLEHIENPAQVIEKIHSLLNNEGVLLITIPNINSIGRFIFRQNWDWVLPWHLHFYSPNTIVRLIKKSGFKKLELYQTPSPLWYPNAMRNCLTNYPRITKIYDFIHPIIKVILLSPLVLIGFILNLNDNMTLICKKQ